MALSEIRIGNIGVADNGSWDNCYIVGDRCGAVLEVNRQESGVYIRSVKYSRHKKGAKREEDANPDLQTRITILLDGGPWKQTMWDDYSQRTSHMLKSPGDYIAWEPGYSHTWEAVGCAVMLSVSLQKEAVSLVLKGEPFKLHSKNDRQASAGTNLVVVEPELAQLFPDTESVNRALRLLANTAQEATDRSRSRRRIPTTKRRT